MTLPTPARKGSRARGLTFALVACLAAGTPGCREEEVTVQELLPSVSVYVLEARTLAEEIKASGDLEARFHTEIAAEVEGRVTDLTIDEGGSVEEGRRRDRDRSRASQARPRGGEGPARAGAGGAREPAAEDEADPRAALAERVLDPAARRSRDDARARPLFGQRGGGRRRRRRAPRWGFLGGGAFRGARGASVGRARRVRPGGNVCSSSSSPSIRSRRSSA